MTRPKLALVFFAVLALLLGGVSSTGAPPRKIPSESADVAAAIPTTLVPQPTKVAAAGAFPDSTNTGVPPGTRLTTYTGPCQLPAGTRLDAKIINCLKTAVQAMGPGVVITRSQVNGRVLSDHANGGGQAHSSISLADSAIDGGAQEEYPAVAYDSVTLLRVDIVRGQHSLQCNSNCRATDSYLHGQYEGANSSGHFNAFISNGGHDFTLRHNTLWCSVLQTSEDGGCSADASLFGDFSPISNVTFVNNLFHATGGSFCLSSGFDASSGKPYSASNVVIRDNVFQRGRNQKCGYFGTVTSVGTVAQGFVVTSNTFDDGSPL